MVGIQHRAAGQFGERHAVEQVVVGADAATAERHQRGVALILLAVELRVAGGRHGRNGDADQEGIAARRRQGLEHFAVERAAGRRVRGFDERRRAGDRHRLLQGADLEREVERQELLGADPDARALVGLEAGQRGLERVGAGLDRRKVVFPRFVGRCFADDGRRFVDQLDGDAGNHAVGVAHRSAHATGERLGGRGTAHQDDRQADSHHLLQALHGHLGRDGPIRTPAGGGRHFPARATENQ